MAKPQLWIQRATKPATKGKLREYFFGAKGAKDRNNKITLSMINAELKKIHQKASKDEGLTTSERKLLRRLLFAKNVIRIGKKRHKKASKDSLKKARLDFIGKSSKLLDESYVAKIVNKYRRVPFQESKPGDAFIR